MTVGLVSALTLVESLAVLLSARNSIKFSAMTLSKRSWLLQEIIFLCIVFQESEHHMCDLHGLCCNKRIRRHIGSSMERYLRESLSNAVHAVIQRSNDCDAKSAKAGMHPALITTCSKKNQTLYRKDSHTDTHVVPTMTTIHNLENRHTPRSDYALGHGACALLTLTCGRDLIKTIIVLSSLSSRQHRHIELFATAL